MSSLSDLFELYSMFGNTQSDGTAITLKNIDKWLKQTNLLGLGTLKAKFTTADTAIIFSKIAKTAKTIDFPQFEQFLEALAQDKKMDAAELKGIMIEAGEPEYTNVTQAISTGRVGESVRRLTDPSLFSGAHKNRFDEEGKGRGIEGREDRMSTTGYVSGFKPESEKEDEADKKKRKDSKS